MAHERLLQRARRRVPEPDRPIVRARAVLLTVSGEGYGRERASVALERLQRCAPIRLHSRLSLDPRGNIIFKCFSNNALFWGEDKC